MIQRGRGEKSLLKMEAFIYVLEQYKRPEWKEVLENAWAALETMRDPSKRLDEDEEKQPWESDADEQLDMSEEAVAAREQAARVKAESRKRKLPEEVVTGEKGLKVLAGVCSELKFG